MALAKIPSKDECIPIELAEKRRGQYEAVISRVFSWPDPIGYALDRDQQGMALIEFPGDHAVVWLERRHYLDASDEGRKSAAERVLREWARL